VGLREPADNKDLFVILFENSIIFESTHRAMMKMAKFRNIIVYDYARIEPEIVIDILKKDIEDFKHFAQQIIRYLDS
jgi:uncharacterized protein YutE (UPF0331/DUF86 family)